jgi:hypothetical protein
MLFVTADDGEDRWRRVCEAIITNKLGTSAKIASQGGSRLICIYTDDFDDTDDVRRVLFSLRDLALLPRDNRIFYKPDVFTHLNIYSNNQWGIKTSLYASRDILEAEEAKNRKAALKKRSSTGGDENASKKAKV